MAKAMDIYKGLPPWAKGVSVLAILGITYLLGTQIIKYVKKDVDKKKAEADIKEVKNEIKDLEKAGEKLSYAKSQYSAWASQIQNQFDGCDISPATLLFPASILGNKNMSNSGVLFGNLLWRLKNNLDFLALVDAYGVRTYDKCGLWNGDFSGNLYQAVSDELDTSELIVINKLLSSKNIKYKF